MSHTVVYSINEKGSNFLKNMHFGVKIIFLKFLRIFWSDLVGAIGFLEAVYMDKLLILSKKFKGPLNAIIILNLESITFSAHLQTFNLLC